MANPALEDVVQGDFRLYEATSDRGQYFFAMCLSNNPFIPRMIPLDAFIIRFEQATVPTRNTPNRPDTLFIELRPDASPECIESLAIMRLTLSTVLAEVTDPEIENVRATMQELYPDRPPHSVFAITTYTRVVHLCLSSALPNVRVQHDVFGITVMLLNLAQFGDEPTRMILFVRRHEPTDPQEQENDLNVIFLNDVFGIIDAAFGLLSKLVSSHRFFVHDVGIELLQHIRLVYVHDHHLGAVERANEQVTRRVPALCVDLRPTDMEFDHLRSICSHARLIMDEFSFRRMNTFFRWRTTARERRGEIEDDTIPGSDERVPRNVILRCDRFRTFGVVDSAALRADSKFVRDVRFGVMGPTDRLVIVRTEHLNADDTDAVQFLAETMFNIGISVPVVTRPTMTYDEVLAELADPAVDLAMNLTRDRIRNATLEFWCLKRDRDYNPDFDVLHPKQATDNLLVALRDSQNASHPATKEILFWAVRPVGMWWSIYNILNTHFVRITNELNTAQVPDGSQYPPDAVFETHDRSVTLSIGRPVGPLTHRELLYLTFVRNDPSRVVIVDFPSRGIELREVFRAAGVRIRDVNGQYE